MNYALYALNIKKTFKKHRKTVQALKGIDLKIEKGEIFGLLGPNGSGKSTFIRIASTLLIPDEGTMKVLGYDIMKDASLVRHLINRVSVEASFFRKLSATENLLFAAGIHGISRKEALAKIHDLAKKVGLDKKRLNDPLEDFSRGMQQKVAIARAFMTDPEIMLLDEPTTGLDPRAKRDVQRLIHEMKSNMKTTVLLTTHDMEEAEKLCDHVSIIHQGRIVVEGTPRELKLKVSEKVRNPTFEDVFMEYTGVSFDDAEFQEVETA